MKDIGIQIAAGIVLALMFCAALIFNDAPLPCLNSEGECMMDNPDEACAQYCEEQAFQEAETKKNNFR